ncbi:MAG: FHA domain-containing protein [Betaproteobacteria bacterium]|nr:FHA domain-containing protein [Betaproteobacteria bacterium]
MAKLIVSQNGEITGNHFLDASSFTIGSRPDNDLCLNVQGVSRLHARITSVGNDDILDDLGSTNGTLVNGQSVTRHILQNDDVIEIADVQIRYRNHKAIDGPSFDRTMIIQASAMEGDASAQPVGAYALATAKNERRLRAGARIGLIRVFNGSPSSKEIELSRVLHTFGIPGKQLAVINARPHGYFITHVEGKKPARLNGKSIGLQPQFLTPNDVIEVGDEKLLFLLK